MMRACVLPSPAKINLFLHIIGRKTNGYHNIQTLFQFLDLCDQLHFEVTDGPIKVDCNWPIPTGDNLVTKSAHLLKSHSKCKKGVHIIVQKQLPMCGGIGGGSSNAATTLHALNKLWGLNLSTPRLMALGLELGADVPVFVGGKSAFGEGIGEKLSPLQPPENCYLLVVPPIAINTQKLYTHPDLKRNTPSITIEDALRIKGHNDFEPLVKKLHPQMDQIISQLQDLGPVQMSGSGSCLFVMCNNQEHAFAAQKEIPDNCKSFICQGLNYSPLFAAIATI